jgi:predicted acylesterase/phospholipase RssA
MADAVKKTDAVFEGGGVKGIGMVGAVAVTEDQGYQFSNVAGTSAGAIVASLVAAGYNAGELKNILDNLDYTHFKDADARYIEDKHFVRSIPIPTLGVQTTDFELPREKAQALYQSGMDAASKFFATWDFEQ